MLWGIIVIDLLAGAVLITAWYFWFARANRLRSLRVLRWIERIFDGHGQIAGVQWLSPSRFYVRLHLAPNPFREGSVSVQLSPREMPIHWLLTRLRKQQETLTFQADLDPAPCFNLEVHNHRWCGRTRRRFPADPQRWTLDHTGPFILTTRTDWQREITHMMNALVASRDCDCMTVCFRRTSPHFSATVPLQAIAPDALADADMFDVLRELAAGASAARF